MNDSTPDNPPPHRLVANPLRAASWIAGVCGILAVAGLALVVIERYRATGTVDWTAVGWGLLGAAGVGAVSTMMLGLARDGKRERPDEDEAASTRALLDEILLVVRDARDNSLLDGPQKRAKAARVEQEELAEGQTVIMRLATDGDFARAEHRLADLQRRYPGRPEVLDLGDRIRRARAARLEQDLASFARRVDEFITISAWQRARETAEQLAARYPDSAQARQLMSRVEREQQLYDDAQRTRLYAEIQRLVQRKRWREAFVSAQAYIERYPNRADADALRVQLDTLHNNADIATRQELETEITELAKRGQYAEAEVLARRVITDFPDSVTAEILRSQIDRLHELATNPNAPPPRMRPSGVSSSSGFLNLK